MFSCHVFNFNIHHHNSLQTFSLSTLRPCPASRTCPAPEYSITSFWNLYDDRSKTLPKMLIQGSKLRPFCHICSYHFICATVRNIFRSICANAYNCCSVTGFNFSKNVHSYVPSVCWYGLPFYQTLHNFVTFLNWIQILDWVIDC